MRADVALRRLRAERRLFEVHGRLVAAREDVEALSAVHAQLQAAADEARARMAVAETALAYLDFEGARREAEAAEISLAAARAVVAELESAKDALFDDLLG